jgi:hypothetical protein
VGTDRRLLGVDAGSLVLLGPDNGLLAPAVAMIGGARRAVELTDDDYRLPSPGPTFAGRDVLAPAAGYLAAGADLAALGPEIDAAALVPGVVSLPEAAPGGAITGEVWWVDRFGNCQLNIDPDTLEAAGTAPGGRVEIRLPQGIRAARWVHTYADAKPSELVILVDSYGLLSLAMYQEPAADALGIHAGSSLTLFPERAGTPLRLEDERPAR